MLVSDTFKTKEKYTPIIEKGVRWLIDIKIGKGWGDFPSEPSNVAPTAADLDNLLKLRRYRSDAPMAHFWAFTK